MKTENYEKIEKNVNLSGYHGGQIVTPFVVQTTWIHKITKNRHPIFEITVGRHDASLGTQPGAYSSETRRFRDQGIATRWVRDYGIYTDDCYALV